MNDSLGDRMKGYELACRQSLPRRLPVIIRVDGKAFHTLTKSAEKPFDTGLGDAMLRVALALCEEIQGAVLAYQQSDEVSVLVHNYRRLNTEAWFDNQIQKMASVSASIATSAFDWAPWRDVHFDSRVFVLPETEVTNYFLWRQQDATRNSIQMLARSLFSHKECHEKNTSELQEMCFQKGHNWNDLPVRWRRGACVRGGAVDLEPPKFGEVRDYIESLLAVEPS